MANSVENPVVEQNVATAVRDTKAIIKNIILNGGKKITGLVVRNVNPEEKMASNGMLYTNFSFSLNKYVPAFVTNNETLVRELGQLNVIFNTSFALASVIREKADMAWVGSHIIEHPKAAKIIFSGATLDIVQEHVPAGTTYINPFTTKENPEGEVFSEDKIINHIVDFKLSQCGIDAIKEIRSMVLMG